MKILFAALTFDRHFNPLTGGTMHAILPAWRYAS
jgi:hypothetical protein